MKYVFCIMQTYVLLTALLQIYQSKPNLPGKTDRYREKRTGTGKNGQLPEKVGKLPEKAEKLPEKSYISRSLPASKKLLYRATLEVLLKGLQRHCCLFRPVRGLENPTP